MSTYKKVVPCLDFKDGRVVKGVKFVGLKDAGDPVELAKYYCESGADELAFLDISATAEGRDTMVEMVKKVAAVATVPFVVGGGIKSIADVERILSAGADKVSLGSAAVLDKEFLAQAAKQFGSQRIIVAVDAAKNTAGGWDVYISGGEKNTGIDAIEWSKEAVALGAGEILLTSKDADGTKDGYDVELTKAVAEAVDVPVTASGGCGKIEDFLNIFKETKVASALAASLFHFGELTIMQVKKYLAENGINVKI